MVIKVKDYYSTLGVSRDATEGDMKKAFRKKAMDYHTDRNKENPKAEEKEESPQARQPLRRE